MESQSMEDAPDVDKILDCVEAVGHEDDVEVGHGL